MSSILILRGTQNGKQQTEKPAESAEKQPAEKQPAEPAEQESAEPAESAEQEEQQGKLLISN